MDRRKEILKRRIEQLEKERGVRVSPFDPEIGFETDGEKIRQLALYSIRTGDNTVLDFIHPYLDFHALYPFEMKFFNTNPDGVLSDEVISKIYEERKIFKNKVVDLEDKIENLKEETNEKY